MSLPPLTADALSFAEQAELGRLLQARFAHDREKTSQLFTGQLYSDAEIDAALGADLRAGLERAGVFTRAEGGGQAHFILKRITGKLVFSDLPRPDFRAYPTMVDPLWEGPHLAPLLVKTKAKRGLDLGCGSGVLGIAVADACEEIYLTDINPRALEIARFNMGVNNFTHAKVMHSDVFDGLPADLKFDRFTFSAPLGEEFAPRNLLEAGEIVFERFMKELPQRVLPGATMQINVCGKDWREGTFHERMQRWLGQQAGAFPYVFLELWRKDSGPRFFARRVYHSLRTGANCLNCVAIYRGLITMRWAPEGGKSWRIPTDYAQWSIEDLDPAAASFLLAMIGPPGPVAGQLAAGEAALIAAGVDLRAKAQPIVVAGAAGRAAS